MEDDIKERIGMFRRRSNRANSFINFQKSRRSIISKENATGINKFKRIKDSVPRLSEFHREADLNLNGRMNSLGVSKELESKLTQLFSNIRRQACAESEEVEIIERYLTKWPKDREIIYEKDLIRKPNTNVNSPRYLRRKTRSLDIRNTTKERKHLIEKSKDLYHAKKKQGLKINSSKERIITNRSDLYYKKFAEKQIGDDISMFLLKKGDHATIKHFISLDNMKGNSKGYLKDFTEILSSLPKKRSFRVFF